jgi:SanA protein
MFKRFFLPLVKAVVRFVGSIILFPFRLFLQILRLLKQGFILFFLLNLWQKIVAVIALFLGSGVLAATIILIGNLIVSQTTKSKIYTLETLPGSYQTGIILGAKVYADGGLSHMTQDRSDTAIELYKQKKVSKLLVSGDHGRENYDEVNTIKNYLLKNGIPENDLFLDHAGFDTYDSLYRARDIFQVESAVIITQDFHLPRSVFLAEKLGVKAVGVRADRGNYGNIQRAVFREKLAIMKAWADVIFGNEPKFLGETIPITGDSKKSWD